MPKKEITLTPGKKISPDEIKQYTTRACDAMEAIYDSGIYPRITVVRHWSKHNPRIDGEFARPRSYRWYLEREIRKLLDKGAEIVIGPSRERIPLSNPEIFSAIDENDWDLRKKKIFLFKPERIDLSLDRLEHYTGTPCTDFQRYILFTNYDMHVEMFRDLFPECASPDRQGVQMPAYHHKLDKNLGISLINIGVGPSNAKTITDHIAVLRPDAMIMVGHCAGLRNHQEIGDFVLASGYMRDDKILDDIIPLNVPIAPNYILNSFLQEELEAQGFRFRLGIVFTTGNRNWEFYMNTYEKLFSVSRSIAIDMESATIAVNGFRYRIPNATLLAISDKPLHGKPKRTSDAQEFYQASKKKHLEIVVNILNTCRESFPDGFPNDVIRGMDEPLFGSV
jgi:AMP nucleosidase